MPLYVTDITVGVQDLKAKSDVQERREISYCIDSFQVPKVYKT